MDPSAEMQVQVNCVEERGNRRNYFIWRVGTRSILLGSIALHFQAQCFISFESIAELLRINYKIFWWKPSCLTKYRPSVLSTKHLHASLQRRKLLLNTATRRPSRLPKYQLSTQRPARRNVPSLRDTFVEHWVEVLKTTTQALGGKSCPCNELVHALGMFIPY